MTELAMNTLAKRLDRLEGENRRLRRMSLMLLLGAATMALMGQTPQHRPLRTLEAEEFLLRDSRGQVRASLGTSQNPSATALQIYNGNGKPRTLLIVSGDGTSSLEFMDTGDRVRVVLGIRDNGSPRVWLGNETGRIIWRAP